MNESSISPFGLRSFIGSLFKQTLARLSKLTRGESEGKRGHPESGSEPSPDLLVRAAEEIRSLAWERATLFERAERLSSRAERLESEGTPSESARQRAERAKEEVRDSLAALREKFADESGEEGLLAFDQEVQRQYPSFEPQG